MSCSDQYPQQLSNPNPTPTHPPPSSSSSSSWSSSSSSSSPLPAIDSLLPRGLCRAWKQAKSRAEVSLTFLEIVATSPVVGLLPALIPPSPRSPSNALILLHRSRMNSSNMQKNSPKPATEMSSDLQFPCRSPSTPPKNLMLNAESEILTPCILKKPRSSASSPFASVRLTHKIYLCTAWIFIWLWRFMCKCYSCLLLQYRRLFSVPSAQKRELLLLHHPGSMTVAVNSISSPNPNARLLTRKNSGKDLSGIANNINSSSKHLKNKLRSSFKSLSVQVPRKAFAPLNHHFNKSPSAAATIFSTPCSSSSSPTPVNSIKASALPSPPYALGSPAKLRSSSLSTMKSPTFTKLSKASVNNTANCLHETISSPSPSPSCCRRSSLSSCNNTSSSSWSPSSSSDLISVDQDDEKQDQQLSSLDSINKIPAKIHYSHLVASSTLCLALGGLIVGKMVAAIAVTGCWLLLLLLLLCVSSFRRR